MGSSLLSCVREGKLLGESVVQAPGRFKHFTVQGLEHLGDPRGGSFYTFEASLLSCAQRRSQGAESYPTCQSTEPG